MSQEQGVSKSLFSKGENMNPNAMSKEAWLAELAQIADSWGYAVEGYADEANWEAWRPYYEQDYTPSQAIHEDMSHA